MIAPASIPRIPYRLLRIDGMVIAGHMEAAHSFWRRARGLIGRRLREDHALWLKPGGSVHTFAMMFPIDILFLDEHLTVLGHASAVPPWRVCLAPRYTRSTVELAAGRISQVGVAPGDELFIHAREV